MSKVKVRFRKTLLSSGEFTPEVVMEDDNVSVYESSPDGLTVGLKERQRGSGELPDDFSFDYESSFSQLFFDTKIAEKYLGEISTALSLAFLRYKSAISDKSYLCEYISHEFGLQKNHPRLIFNILNGGKHAGNGLSFCEFMIVPKQEGTASAIRVASEVYNDLRTEILNKYSEKDVLVGREGGFAPHISDVNIVLDLILAAINTRHKGEVDIAIDVAANHFSTQRSRSFIYKVDGKSLSSHELLSYYKKMLSKYPEIRYVEDCFHENDLESWSFMMREFGDEIDVVADDLTVTNTEYAKKYFGLYNSCILKVNQVGTVSRLTETLKFCKQKDIKTIISQRSAETDSNILTHLAVGLGADYMKAGAPARERIVKYNELLRMLT
jgi:enolase